MIARRAVLAAVLLLAGGLEALADHKDHPAPAADQAGPGMLKITDGAKTVMRTAAVTCDQGGGRCYSQDELTQIADRLAAQFPLLPDVKKILNSRKPDAVVNEADIRQITDYLAAEQRGMEILKAQLTPQQWALVQRGSPAQAFAVFRSLPPEIRKQLMPHIADVAQRMKDLMRPNDLNPFHDGLAKEDSIAKNIMDRVGQRPVMTGPQWQGVDPGNANAYTYGAQQSLQQGDPRAAADQARQALAIDGGNAEAYSLLGAANYDMKQWQDASAAARSALNLDPNDARAQAVLSLAHAPVTASVPSTNAGGADSSALARAWSSRAELDAAQASQADGFARQAEQALSVKDWAQAAAKADQALSVDPRYAYAYGLKAFAELKGGRPEAGLLDSVTGLSIDPKDKMSQKARAQALLRLGRYREALAAAVAAGQEDPSSGLARYLEAAARNGLGDRAGALDALRQAAALDARYASIYQAALVYPKNDDMALLFGDDVPKRAAQAVSARGRRAGRFLSVVGAASAGGLALALGLMGLYGGRVKQALTTVFTRSRSPRSRPTTLAGQYRTLRQIGAGGMGMVYEATDVSLDRRVAVKKMRDELRVDPRERQRFVSEARLVAALRHPNIVEIYAIVDREEELALVFEFVSGKTLHEIISLRGRLPFAEAMNVFRGMSAALESAHARGIIHRDLKPSNVMITDEGAAKVMDFGIARAAKDALSRFSMTNTIVGTPPYMAPEQEQGVVRKESDVYALGVCLYEMLCGGLPFAGGSAGGILMSKINKSYTPASRVAEGLPEGVDAVFDKALEPDPERRYRSVAELRQALEALRVPV